MFDGPRALPVTYRCEGRSMRKKRAGKKAIYGTIYSDDTWSVKNGRVVRLGAGKVKKGHLFKLIGEKIPFAAVSKVEKHARNILETVPNGVYLAMDSMGCPRYTGRGAIFSRLKAHKKAYPVELEFFSFYVVEDKQHEREIETLLIRSASFLSVLNERKVRASIAPGSVLDYEVGTKFVERQFKKGRKSA
jgi:hypothetical protein